MKPATTILLIHGVGDLPNKATSRKCEQMISSAIADERAVRFIWFDWNKAISEEKSKSLFNLANISHAARISARLEFPEHVQGKLNVWLWKMERFTERIQLLAIALLILHCIWAVIAYFANLLQQDPPPLALHLELGNILFPPLHPLLLARSLPLALQSIPFTAIGALVIIPLFQSLLAISSGGVSLKLALRRAVLDITRPVLGIMTTPGQLISMLVFFTGFLAFVFGIFSRPLQVIDIEGNTISYGNRLMGVIGLPLALLTGSLIIGVLTFLLRKPLKVVADIVRYLGHPGYRMNIHHALVDRLREIDEGAVIILAHSLGSVIAVDSLLAHPEAWSRTNTLQLLTFGSPLQRLFHRFFPLSYPTSDGLYKLLKQTYRHFSWTNAYRPLDYVGKKLGKEEHINNKCLRQGWSLHTGYWTDLQLTTQAGMLVMNSTVNSTNVKKKSIKTRLSLDRFYASSIEEERWLNKLVWLVYMGGILLLLASQFMWEPSIEKIHLREWELQLENEGVDWVGKLCPQREEDVSGEFPGFQRAVAGIQYCTADGREWVVEAYASSRPDIDWDEVQIAVFGKLPPSPLITGLLGFFRSDPLLAVEECQRVYLRYAKSDPRIFIISEKYHMEPSTGLFTRIVRAIVLFLMWGVWWMMLSFMLKEVLGISALVTGLSQH